MNGKVLDPDHVVRTVERLRRRIQERFPGSSLLEVCGETLDVARQAGRRAEWLSSPIWPLRAAIGAVLAATVFVGIKLVPGVYVPEGRVELPIFLQALEAGANDFLLAAAGLFFLVSWERRIKRDRALRALHELRSLAHIIDMHQLTKDPDRVLSNRLNTVSSPSASTSGFLLGRYLDYCSELLSLVSKVAALYAAGLDDAVVLSSVTEIENLTSGLSRKIWQKILILNAMERSLESRRSQMPD